MNTTKKSFQKGKSFQKSSSPQKSFHKASNKKSYRTKNYSVAEEDISQFPVVVGIYSQSSQNDFGFIDVEWLEKGYFVYPKNLNGALDGDTVEAYIKVFNRRKEAVITKIVKRSERILVGTVDLVKDFAFVVLDNPAFKVDVHISNKKLAKYKGNIKSGDKVAIKITKWEGKNPEGSIFEILGDPLTKGVDIMWLALENGARIKFPTWVLEEASKLSFEPQKHRIDLSEMLTFTIDGEDAKDLDDAISIEKITSNSKNIPENIQKEAYFRLIVSIADVAEYVKEGSEIDKEALKRGNSTYLVDRVIPMLPEKLSNDLCSLNANTQKLTLSCEMILDKTGKVLYKKAFESIIISNARLTYKEVQEIIDGKKSLWSDFMFWWILTQDIYEAVENINELRNIVSHKKKQTGILDFDFPEIKILLDKHGHPLEIKKYERYNSMKIIEECMVLANESIGELYRELPFLYRIHPIPGEEDIEKLRSTLAIFGVILPFKKITPKVISEVLEQIKNSPKEKLLSKLVLRSLEKAIYSEKNEGHFGLWLDFYSHFTSPIRRYPDLQIHRIIKQFLHKELDPLKKEFYKNHLPTVAKSTSETERKSEKLEYAVRDLMIVKYYQDKIGQEFEWVISGMIPSGCFVELENTAEGFVSFDQVAKKEKYTHFEFDEAHMKTIFPKNFFLQVGDTLKISVGSVEMERRRLNFDFIEKK